MYMAPYANEAAPYMYETFSYLGTNTYAFGQSKTDWTHMISTTKCNCAHMNNLIMTRHVSVKNLMVCVDHTHTYKPNTM